MLEITLNSFLWSGEETPMMWERIPDTDPNKWRRDLIGRRTLADGTTEYLCHNEAMCNPYYTAAFARSL